MRKIHRKHLCRSLFFNKVRRRRPEAYNSVQKETLTQVFSCEHCEIFEDSFFCRTPSVVNIKLAFMDWVFLEFDSTNSVMQNPTTPKFRQSSIIYQISGYLSEKSKALASSNYHWVCGNQVFFVYLFFK